MFMISIILVLLISSTSLPSKSRSPRCLNTAEYSLIGAGLPTNQCAKCLDSKSVGGKSIFTIVPRGQLGNHLSAYASLVALRDHFEYHKFYVSSETWKYLTAYFEPSQLLLQSVDTLCLCKSLDGVPTTPLKWDSFNSELDADYVEDFSKLERDQGRGWILWTERGFVARDNHLGLDLLDQADRRVRDSLRFRDKFLTLAQERFSKAVKKWFVRNKKKVRRRDLTERDVKVVGIHHRRGDHLDYERVYNIPHITMTYLGPSMDLFLDKYNNSVVFIYVSDDKVWGEKHFQRDRNVVISRSAIVSPAQATGSDLALLSLCGDIITSRGTFSLWAARLAGGSTIRPCMFPHTSTHQEIEHRGNRWPNNPLKKNWQTSLWRLC